MKKYLATGAIIFTIALILLSSHDTPIATDVQESALPASAVVSSSTTEPRKASQPDRTDLLQNAQPSATNTTPIPQTQAASNVTFIIASTSYPTFVREGTNVLDAMRALQATTDFTFTGQNYSSLGYFVESINGVKNDDGYYWFLYVNGRSSDTGASQTTLKPGDTVEWRYKKNY